MIRFSTVVPLLLVAALVVPQAAADDYLRDARVDVLDYRFVLELGDDSNEIVGQASIRARFLEAGVTELALDLVGDGDSGMRVTAVDVDGASASFEHAGDRLRIALPHAPPAGDVRVVRVEYRGAPGDGLAIGENLHGERTFFGDNWPARARHWLPTVDHVSDKATVEFDVRAPDRYQVVANGRLLEESDLPDGRHRTRWRTDVAVPTKVMVIGVARFAVQHLLPVGAVPVQSWVYPQDRERGFVEFARARPILDYFSTHIGSFPYAKLANVQSTTRYGGMENAGSIFYRETIFRGDRNNEGLLAHEIAHQWFGDSVSEADWHHVWLSEGFATYFTQLYMEHAHGRDTLAEGMSRSRGTVLRFGERDPEAAVVNESITDLDQLLNTLSYQKGGWVLHMLRRQVGDAAFWAGVRRYYATYRDGNALTDDLRAVMEAESGEQLDWFFRQWIFAPGEPQLTGTWTWNEASGQLHVELEQVQAGPPFRIAVDLGIEAPGGAVTVAELNMDGRRASLNLPLPEAPSDVRLDPAVWLLYRDAGFGPARGRRSP